MQLVVEITSTTCYTCSPPVYMTSAELAAYHRSGKTFHCLDGHGTHFIVNGTEAERRLKRELEAAQAAKAQVDRQREEAEKRAASQEERALKAEREALEGKRTLKRGLKVAAHAIKTPPPRRGARGEFEGR